MTGRPPAPHGGCPELLASSSTHLKDATTRQGLKVALPDDCYERAWLTGWWRSRSLRKGEIACGLTAWSGARS